MQQAPRSSPNRAKLSGSLLESLHESLELLLEKLPGPPVRRRQIRPAQTQEQSPAEDEVGHDLRGL